MTHIVTKEKAEFDAIQSGKMPFFIHKISKYAVDPGEKIIFQQTHDGQHTGAEFEAYATYVESEGLMKNRQAVALHFNINPDPIKD
jgi:hypothetical protein